MSLVLNYLASPIRTLVTQALQATLSKYIQGIHLDSLGVFGELVLNDLELRKDVIRSSLNIPLSFEVTRGYIRELRILIPWTQLLSQPIEIKISTIELILRFDLEEHNIAKQESESRKESCGKGDSENANDEASKKAPERSASSGGGWTEGLLKRLAANISLTLTNLVFKFEQKDIVLSLALPLLEIYSADSQRQWQRCCAEPVGPGNVLSKCITVHDLSVLLDEFRVETDSIRRSTLGLSLPILSRVSVQSRLQIALNPETCGESVNYNRSFSSSSTHENTFCQYFAVADDIKSKVFSLPGHEKSSPPVRDIPGLASLLFIDIYVKSISLAVTNKHLELILKATKERRNYNARRQAKMKRQSAEPRSEVAARRNTESTTVNNPDAASTRQTPRKFSFFGALDALMGNDETDPLVQELLSEGQTVMENQLNATTDLRIVPMKMVLLLKVSSFTFDLLLCEETKTITDNKPVDVLEDQENPDLFELVPVANVGMVKVRKDTGGRQRLPSVRVTTLATLTFDHLIVRIERLTLLDQCINDIEAELRFLALKAKDTSSSAGDLSEPVASCGSWLWDEGITWPAHTYHSMTLFPEHDIRRVESPQGDMERFLTADISGTMFWKTKSLKADKLSTISLYEEKANHLDRVAESSPSQQTILSILRKLFDRSSSRSTTLDAIREVLGGDGGLPLSSKQKIESIVVIVDYLATVAKAGSHNPLAREFENVLSDIARILLPIPVTKMSQNPNAITVRLHSFTQKSTDIPEDLSKRYEFLRTVEFNQNPQQYIRAVIQFGDIRVSYEEQLKNDFLHLASLLSIDTYHTPTEPQEDESDPFIADAPNSDDLAVVASGRGGQSIDIKLQLQDVEFLAPFSRTATDTGDRFCLGTKGLEFVVSSRADGRGSQIRVIAGDLHRVSVYLKSPENVDLHLLLLQNIYVCGLLEGSNQGLTVGMEEMKLELNAPVVKYTMQTLYTIMNSQAALVQAFSPSHMRRSSGRARIFDPICAKPLAKETDAIRITCTNAVAEFKVAGTTAGEMPPLKKKTLVASITSLEAVGKKSRSDCWSSLLALRGNLHGSGELALSLSVQLEDLRNGGGNEELSNLRDLSLTLHMSPLSIHLHHLLTQARRHFQTLDDTVHQLYPSAFNSDTSQLRLSPLATAKQSPSISREIPRFIVHKSDLESINEVTPKHRLRVFIEVASRGVSVTFANGLHFGFDSLRLQTDNSAGALTACCAKNDMAFNYFWVPSTKLTVDAIAVTIVDRQHNTFPRQILSPTVMNCSFSVKSFLSEASSKHSSITCSVQFGEIRLGSSVLEIDMAKRSIQQLHSSVQHVQELLTRWTDARSRNSHSEIPDSLSHRVAERHDSCVDLQVVFPLLCAEILGVHIHRRRAVVKGVCGFVKGIAVALKVSPHRKDVRFQVSDIGVQEILRPFSSEEFWRNVDGFFRGLPDRCVLSILLCLEFEDLLSIRKAIVETFSYDTENQRTPLTQEATSNISSMELLNLAAEIAKLTSDKLVTADEQDKDVLCQQSSPIICTAGNLSIGLSSTVQEEAYFIDLKFSEEAASSIIPGTRKISFHILPIDIVWKADVLACILQLCSSKNEKLMLKIHEGQGKTLEQNLDRKFVPSAETATKSLFVFDFTIHVGKFRTFFPRSTHCGQILLSAIPDKLENREMFLPFDEALAFCVEAVDVSTERLAGQHLNDAVELVSSPSTVSPLVLERKFIFSVGCAGIYRATLHSVVLVDESSPVCLFYHNARNLHTSTGWSKREERAIPLSRGVAIEAKMKSLINPSISFAADLKQRVESILVLPQPDASPANVNEPVLKVSFSLFLHILDNIKFEADTQDIMSIFSALVLSTAKKQYKEEPENVGKSLHKGGNNGQKVGEAELGSKSERTSTRSNETEWQIHGSVPRIVLAVSGSSSANEMESATVILEFDHLSFQSDVNSGKAKIKAIRLASLLYGSTEDESAGNTSAIPLLTFGMLEKDDLSALDVTAMHSVQNVAIELGELHVNLNLEVICRLFTLIAKPLIEFVTVERLWVSGVNKRKATGEVGGGSGVEQTPTDHRKAQLSSISIISRQGVILTIESSSLSKATLEISHFQAHLRDTLPLPVSVDVMGNSGHAHRGQSITAFVGSTAVRISQTRCSHTEHDGKDENLKILLEAVYPVLYISETKIAGSTRLLPCIDIENLNTREAMMSLVKDMHIEVGQVNLYCGPIQLLNGVAIVHALQNCVTSVIVGLGKRTETMKDTDGLPVGEVDKNIGQQSATMSGKLPQFSGFSNLKIIQSKSRPGPNEAAFGNVAEDPTSIENINLWGPSAVTEASDIDWARVSINRETAALLQAFREHVEQEGEHKWYSIRINLEAPVKINRIEAQPMPLPPSEIALAAVRKELSGKDLLCPVVEDTFMLVQLRRWDWSRQCYSDACWLWLPFDERSLAQTQLQPRSFVSALASFVDSFDAPAVEDRTIQTSRIFLFDDLPAGTEWEICWHTQQTSSVEMQSAMASMILNCLRVEGEIAVNQWPVLFSTVTLESLRLSLLTDFALPANDGPLDRSKTNEFLHNHETRENMSLEIAQGVGRFLQEKALYSSQGGRETVSSLGISFGFASYVQTADNYVRTSLFDPSQVKAFLKSETDLSIGVAIGPLGVNITETALRAISLLAQQYTQVLLASSRIFALSNKAEGESLVSPLKKKNTTFLSNFSRSHPAFSEKGLMLSRFLPNVGLVLYNLTGQTIWFGQHGSDQSLEISYGSKVPYSWKLLDPLRSAHKLRFAIESCHKPGTPAVWSEPVEVDQIGIVPCPVRQDASETDSSVLVGGMGDSIALLWIVIEKKGMQMIVTLRSSHCFESFLDKKVSLTLTRGATGEQMGDSRPMSSSLDDAKTFSLSIHREGQQQHREHVLCAMQGSRHKEWTTISLQVSITDNRGQPTNSIALQTRHAPLSAVVDGAKTEEGRTKAPGASIAQLSSDLVNSNEAIETDDGFVKLVVLQDGANHFCCWLRVFRAKVQLRTATQSASLPSPRYWGWLCAELWPVLEVTNKASLPIEVRLRDSTSVRQSGSALDSGLDTETTIIIVREGESKQIPSFSSSSVKVALCVMPIKFSNSRGAENVEKEMEPEPVIVPINLFAASVATTKQQQDGKLHLPLNGAAEDKDCYAYVAHWVDGSPFSKDLTTKIVVSHPIKCTNYCNIPIKLCRSPVSALNQGNPFVVSIAGGQECSLDWIWPSSLGFNGSMATFYMSEESSGEWSCVHQLTFGELIIIPLDIGALGSHQRRVLPLAIKLSQSGDNLQQQYLLEIKPRISVINRLQSDLQLKESLPLESDLPGSERAQHCLPTGAVMALSAYVDISTGEPQNQLEPRRFSWLKPRQSITQSRPRTEVASQSLMQWKYELLLKSTKQDVWSAPTAATTLFKASPFLVKNPQGKPVSWTKEHRRYLLRFSSVNSTLLSLYAEEIDGSIFLIVSEETHPPLHIKNLTNFHVHLRLDGGSAEPLPLLPQEAVDYDWLIQMLSEDLAPHSEQNARDSGDFDDEAQDLGGGKEPSDWQSSSRVLRDRQKRRRRGSTGLLFRISIGPSISSSNQPTVWSEAVWFGSGMQFISVPLPALDLRSSAPTTTFVIRVFNRAGGKVMVMEDLTATETSGTQTNPDSFHFTWTPKILSTSKGDIKPLSLQLDISQLSLGVFNDSQLAPLKQHDTEEARAITSPDDIEYYLDLRDIYCAPEAISVRLGHVRLKLSNHCTVPADLIASGSRSELSHVRGFQSLELKLFDLKCCSFLPGAFRDIAHFRVTSSNEPCLGLTMTRVETHKSSGVQPYYHQIEATAGELVVQVDDALVQSLIGLGIDIAGALQSCLVSPNSTNGQPWVDFIEMCLNEDNLERDRRDDVDPAAVAFEQEERFVMPTAASKMLVYPSPPTGKLHIDKFTISTLNIIVTAEFAGQFYISVENMPLAFSAVEFVPLTGTAQEISKDIAASYVADAILISPAILGSLNLLGNPSAFVRSFSTGIQDLISMPLVALREGGLVGFARGVSSGVGSFTRHASEGALLSVSGFSTSLARNLSKISGASSLETSYQTSRPENVTQGVVRGIQYLGSSFFDAATGIVTNPWISYQNHQSVLKGLGTGLVGIVAKPIEGAAAFVSQTSLGIIGSVGASQRVQHGSQDMQLLAFQTNEELYCDRMVLKQGERRVCSIRGAMLEQRTAEQYISMIKGEASFASSSETETFSSILKITFVATILVTSDQRIIVQGKQGHNRWEATVAEIAVSDILNVKQYKVDARTSLFVLRAKDPSISASSRRVENSSILDTKEQAARTIGQELQTGGEQEALVPGTSSSMAWGCIVMTRDLQSFLEKAELNHRLKS